MAMFPTREFDIVVEIEPRTLDRPMGNSEIVRAQEWIDHHG